MFHCRSRDLHRLRFHQRGSAAAAAAALAWRVAESRAVLPQARAAYPDPINKDRPVRSDAFSCYCIS
uniref:Putative secreted peptide n=1 Tax=Anopheles braziliensis TaxID=58242 RepID=A0A2M3ZRL1_9DIPT